MIGHLEISVVHIFNRPKKKTSYMFKYICDTQYIILPQEFQHS
jgi:hypothetical protein